MATLAWRGVLFGCTSAHCLSDFSVLRRLHFSELFRRYGAPVLVVNLVKKNEKKPRESLIGASFADLVKYLNQSLPLRNYIQYFGIDYSALVRGSARRV